MMSSIDRYSVISKENLDSKFYFNSLLEEGLNCNLLDENEVERIQISCIELLAESIKKYTMGDSSSVKVEVAQEIMNSNLYTIGLYLKTFQYADDAIEELKSKSVFNLYDLGKKVINNKIMVAKHFHRKVLNTLIQNDNYTYNSTIVDGIEGFFKIYNKDFEADKIKITADYPVFNQVENLVGIEFIVKYLESIFYENLFCEKFSKEAINSLLRGFNENYKDLVFNIFEKVFVNALGCVLVNKEVQNLDISRIQVEMIYQMLFDKDHNDVTEIFYKALNVLIDKLEIDNNFLIEYLKVALDKVVVEVESCIKIDKLEMLFLQCKASKINEKVEVFFGSKMEDNKYRKVVDELLSCRFESDRIDIINEELVSLADLEDVFSDAELTRNEFYTILSKLEIIELAALVKKYIVDSCEDTEFIMYLKEYINDLSKEKKILIKNISQNIIIK